MDESSTYDHILTSFQKYREITRELTSLKSETERQGLTMELEFHRREIEQLFSVRQLEIQLYIAKIKKETKDITSD